MSDSASRRLRAAFDAAREESGALAGPLVEIGRPLLDDGHGLSRVPHDTSAEAGSDAVGGGLAWGTLSDEALAAWMARVPIGAVAAQVFASARPGARGMLDRVMLLPARETPQVLEEVCTALFVRGLGSLRVIELEPRRNVVGVLGVRRF